MSRLAAIARKAVDLVARAREEARDAADEHYAEESHPEDDFEDDLEEEFYSDPPAFAMKYAEYLGDLDPGEMRAVTNQRLRK